MADNTDPYILKIKKARRGHAERMKEATRVFNKSRVAARREQIKANREADAILAEAKRQHSAAIMRAQSTSVAQEIAIATAYENALDRSKLIEQDDVLEACKLRTFEPQKRRA